MARHPDRFAWTLTEGPGTEAVQLVVEEEEVDNEVLSAALTELIEWHGGFLLGSRVFIDLKAWRPETYENFRKEIGQVGGLKKFVARHPDRFRWAPHGEDGKDTVFLVKEAPDFEALIEPLVQLIEWNKGSLLASKVFKELKAWKPREVERFRKEVDDAGTLKKLIQRYPDKFEWVVDSNPGKELVRLVNAKAEPEEKPRRIEVADTSGMSRYQ